MKMSIPPPRRKKTFTKEQRWGKAIRANELANFEQAWADEEIRNAVSNHTTTSLVNHSLVSLAPAGGTPRETKAKEVRMKRA